jgi:class 3 adenylate cyclase
MSAAPERHGSRALRAENAAPQSRPQKAWWNVMGLRDPETSMSTVRRPLPAELLEVKAGQFPRWWSVWARSVGIGGFVVGLVALFMLLHHPGELGETLAVWAVGAQVVVTVVFLPVAFFSGRPLERLRRSLLDGVNPLELPRGDVIYALRLSNGLFWSVWVAHGIFAIIFSVAALRFPLLGPTLVDVVPGAIALGLISASSQALVIDVMVRRRVSPLLLPQGRLDHLVDEKGRLPRTFVWQLLAMMAGTLGIAWPVLLFTMFRVSGSDGIAKFIVLGVMFTALFLTMLAGLMASIAGGTGHLAARMDEVTTGDLTVQARIFNLDTFGILVSDFNRMVEGLRQREQLKESFGRYVTQQVVDEILAGRVALGGELKTATVLFSDIRGFTRMSEQLTPQEVVAFLNEYLEAMVDCVIEHGGVLDKFIGDAVMAVFGAPVSAGDVADDARAAVACAIAMQSRLIEINERRAARGQAAIKIGIGVHTGPLVAGNIGSTRRMQYTVIGDTVNVGSRLESLTKEHHRGVLLSAATADLVRKTVELVEVGEVPVRGRTVPLTIYGLKSEAPAEQSV